MPADPDSALERPPSLPGRLKAWADATSTLVKAGLSVFCVLAVALIVCIGAWRDQTSHDITITLSPGTDHALLARGSDLDLRQALLDAMNDRVRSVKAVALLQGLAQEVHLEESEAISFKPFGVDMSVSESNEILRFLRHAPQRLKVAIELVCTSAACGEPGARADSLLVTLSGPQLDTRTSYRLPAGGPALRRALDQLAQHTADTLVQRSEPLIAALYSLNMALQDVFPDMKARAFEQATGLASSLRGGNAEDRCFADLVPGMTQIFRGELSDGANALRRTLQSADVPCEMRAGLLGVLVLGARAVCSPSYDERQADIALAGKLIATLSKLDLKGSGEMAHRLSFVRLFVPLAQAIRDADAPIRAAICLQGGTAQAAGSAAVTVQQVQAVLGRMRTDLPPNAQPSGEHAMLLWMRLLIEAGIPRQDLQSRYELARDVLQFAADYARLELHPRTLFLLAGRMQIDIAIMAHDALALAPPEKMRLLAAIGADTEEAGFDPDAFLRGAIPLRLNLARTAFGNALATDTPSRLDEPSPDIEPLTLLGDAAFYAGDEAAASDAYGRAIDAFAQDDEPVNQILPLAVAASHWAGLLRLGGACSAPAVADTAWEAHWARLGGGPRDPCAAVKPGHAASMFALVSPLIQGVIADCYPRAADDAALSPDTPAAIDARFSALACQRSREVSTNPAVVSFFRSRTGADVNDRIAEALAVPAAAGALP